MDENVTQTNDSSLNDAGASHVTVMSTLCSENKEPASSAPSAIQDASSPPPGPEPAFRMPAMIFKKKPVVASNVLFEDENKTNVSSEKRLPLNSDTSSLNSKRNISPAEKLKLLPLPYKEPDWGGICTQSYNFEVVKEGAILKSIDLTVKSFHVIGRLDNCDVVMEHPSLSRYHAVVQYCATPTERHDVGWYLYDLESTHGSCVNKVKVKPRIYQRIYVGHVIKFGGSSRLFILQGPDSDKEEESSLTITELKEKREQQKKELENLKNEKDQVSTSSEEGCSWGINLEDEVEEEPVDAINPFAVEALNEELYLDDPKKTLRGYFEREGLEMPQYEAEEVSYGQHKLRLELPIDGPDGKPIYAEALVKGKKKEAVIECALEACRILDRHGVLRQAEHVSRKKKTKNWEDDDFYDSDEDPFLDRTGSIEKKRQQRMRRLGKTTSTTANYDSLATKLKEIQTEIESIEKKLQQAKIDAAKQQADDVDALDAYMSAIKSGALDTRTRMKMKAQLIELRKEEHKTQRLCNLAKPADMPELKKLSEMSSPQLGNNQNLPLVGKRRGSGRFNAHVLGPSRPPSSVQVHVGDEEEEEDDSDDQASKDSRTIGPKVQQSEKQVDKDDSDNKDSIATEIDNQQNNKVGQKSQDKKTSILNEFSESVKPALTDCSIAKGEATTVSSRLQLPTNAGGTDISRVSTSESPTPVSDSSSKSTTDSSLLNSAKKEKAQKRQLPAKSIQEKEKRSKLWSKEYCESDPDYSTWLPPEGQSGDGRTFLNEKLGY